MQRYYVQYLSGFDAVALNQMISMLVTMSEDESVILASIQSTIAQLSVTQGDLVTC
jgi:NCK-associated protein 1